MLTTRSASRPPCPVCTPMTRMPALRAAATPAWGVLDDDGALRGDDQFAGGHQKDLGVRLALLYVLPVGDGVEQVMQVQAVQRCRDVGVRSRGGD